MQTYSLSKLLLELKRDEGYKLNAYKDSLGFWTVGVGHLLGSSMRMEVITDDECTALLLHDINEAEVRLSKIFPDWTTHFDDVRQRALLNMTFNLGMKLLQFQKFRASMQLEHYEMASKEMLQSLWAKQVGARALRLSEMILKGNEYDA